ncbi:hypothetical protein PM082_009408 [Marasmius tenuissimus]|nr:hypothetical protein PM082_009408 [Marasmius tenuissimus]
MPMGSAFHNLRGDAGHACVLQKDVRAVAVPIMNMNLHAPTFFVVWTHTTDSPASQILRKPIQMYRLREEA